MPVGAPFAVFLCLVTSGAAMAESSVSGGFPSDAVAGDLLIRPGTSPAKPMLGFGWGRAERVGGRNVRWVNHLEADLHFEVDEPAQTRIWLSATPLYLQYRRQVVALYVNGAFVAEWVFPARPGFAAFSTVVPAARFRPGRNVITLRAGHRSKGEGNRTLSMAVEGLLLRFE